MELKRLCIFCGSRKGNSEGIQNVTEELGSIMLKDKIDLVYGGGTIGIMGIIARAVHNGGGNVVGVIPTAMMKKEICDDVIGDVIQVHTMHERKLKMHDLADAFMALPGGMGTLEELLETITWSQIGIHKKPIGILNIENYFDPLIAMIDNAVSFGFLKPEDRDFLIVDSDPSQLIKKIREHIPPKPHFEWKP